MSRKQLSANEKQKIKMKKNANDYVNFEEEKRKDPKYKTELCKSWNETGFCAYGNKCRFAHGRNELFGKNPTSNYKRKLCKSFKENGICLYGERCNFKHNEKKLSDIHLPYYYIRLFIKHDLSIAKRLKVFEEISELSNNENCSDSTLSNEDNNSSGQSYHSNIEECKESDEMEFPIESVVGFMM